MFSLVSKDNHWKKIVDLTKIKKGGVDIDELLMAIEKRSDKTYNQY